jgi:hypothetical protein
MKPAHPNTKITTASRTRHAPAPTPPGPPRWFTGFRTRSFLSRPLHLIHNLLDQRGEVVSAHSCLEPNMAQADDRPKILPPRQSPVRLAHRTTYVDAGRFVRSGLLAVFWLRVGCGLAVCWLWVGRVLAVFFRDLISTNFQTHTHFRRCAHDRAAKLADFTANPGQPTPLLITQKPRSLDVSGPSGDEEMAEEGSPPKVLPPRQPPVRLGPPMVVSAPKPPILPRKLCRPLKRGLRFGADVNGRPLQVRLRKLVPPAQNQPV